MSNYESNFGQALLLAAALLIAGLLFVGAEEGSDTAASTADDSTFVLLKDAIGF
ncbi:hypothetical protein [Pseudomonas sp. N040]|uniref:hypothetical protein n=1 Tax=Pseudomonas sp. N040 TaxID=2785325 RepID=UPI0018A2EE1A|nr:hypothetical protein [Pseudomonas sp. N040]MBF7731239.1 hypothetical protein [Pseudomonas sp. N040]MBW7014882.1 hypothetical protein [Pseudomonas sp. N040]